MQATGISAQATFATVPGVACTAYHPSKRASTPACPRWHPSCSWTRTVSKEIEWYGPRELPEPARPISEIPSRKRATVCASSMARVNCCCVRRLPQGERAASARAGARQLEVSSMSTERVNGWCTGSTYVRGQTAPSESPSSVRDRSLGFPKRPCRFSPCRSRSNSGTALGTVGKLRTARVLRRTNRTSFELDRTHLA